MSFFPSSLSSSPNILPLTYFLSTVYTHRSLLNMYEVQVFHSLSQLRNHVMYIVVCFIILPTHFLKSFTCLQQTAHVVHNLVGSFPTSQPRHRRTVSVLYEVHICAARVKARLIVCMEIWQSKWRVNKILLLQVFASYGSNMDFL
jgi:hypothetical protein